MSVLIAAELYQSTTDPSTVRIYVDSSQIVLEHHRSFTPFISQVLIAAELYTRVPQILHPIYISKPAGSGKKKFRVVTGDRTQGLHVYEIRVCTFMCMHVY